MALGLAEEGEETQARIFLQRARDAIEEAERSGSGGGGFEGRAPFGVGRDLEQRDLVGRAAHDDRAFGRRHEDQAIVQARSGLGCRGIGRA